MFCPYIVLDKYICVIIILYNSVTPQTVICKLIKWPSFQLIQSVSTSFCFMVRHPTITPVESSLIFGRARTILFMYKPLPNKYINNIKNLISLLKTSLIKTLHQSQTKNYFHILYKTDVVLRNFPVLLIKNRKIQSIAPLKKICIKMFDNTSCSPLLAATKAFFMNFQI